MPGSSPPPATAADEPFTPVKSADRTLDVLEALAAAGPLSRTDLAARLGIPRSSLHGILHTMEHRGWLEMDAGRATYRLGMRSLIVGAAFVDEDLVVARTSPILDELAAATGETVHLGRLVGAEILYMAKRESVHPLRMFSAVGRRLPAHATALGKALLAQRTDDEVLSVLPATIEPITANTLRTPAAVLRSLDAVRTSGYAIDNEEATIGLRCFAVALPFRSPAADAISVSIPIARLDPTVEDDVVARLQGVVARLQRATG